MLMEGGENATIEKPIEQRNTGKGNPNAIIHFSRPLNQRQEKLLQSLKAYNSRLTVRKKEVNMKDLAALTAHTGVEYAMFTRKGERLIIRGSAVKTDVDLLEAEALAKAGYRWSGHTHPGIDVNTIIASKGDYDILRAFGQKYSVVYDSTGRYGIFGGDDNE